jgi:hypothetical protein
MLKNLREVDSNATDYDIHLIFEACSSVNEWVKVNILINSSIWLLFEVVSENVVKSLHYSHEVPECIFLSHK